MKKQSTLEDVLFRLGIVAGIVGGAGIAVYFLCILPHFTVPPCIFLTFFGLYCPGCGGTRAVDALLQGHLLLSLWYHPIVLYTVIIYGGFMLTQLLDRCGLLPGKGWKFHSWHLYGAIVLIAANFILKNLLKSCFGILL